MPKSITDSANISSLDSKILASICNGKIYVDVTPSVFIGSGGSSVLGVRVKVINPLGVVIMPYRTSGYDLVHSTGTVEVNLPTEAGNFQYGIYTVEVTLYDAGGTPYVLSKTVKIAYPNSKNKTKKYGCISATIKGICKDGKAVISVNNPPTYLGKIAESAEHDYELQYPTGSLTDPFHSNYPMFSTSLFEGVYKLIGDVCATYNFEDNVYVDVPYKLKVEKKISCIINQSDVFAWVAGKHKQIGGECTEEQKYFLTYEVLNALALLRSAELANEVGEDASVFVEELEEITGCNCACSENEGTPITGGGVATDLLIEGCNVSSEQVGLTKVYTLENTDYSISVDPQASFLTASAPSLVNCEKTIQLGFDLLPFALALNSAFGGSINVKWFGAKGDGATDDTAAFNSAIALANTINTAPDRAGASGVSIFIPKGRYNLPAQLTAITNSNIHFIGESKFASILLLSYDGATFKIGDDSSGMIIGSSFSDLKLEYIANPTANAVVFSIQYANDVQFSNLNLFRVNTLADIGASSTRYAAGLTFSNITGATYNGGKPVWKVNHGAGLTIKDSGLFVSGVGNPAINRSSTMTTVPYTNVVDFGAGSWDTFNMSNCFFERYFKGIQVVAAPTSTVINFFVSNCVFDYLRSDCIWLQSASGTVVGTKFSNCWFTCWEGVGAAMFGTGLVRGHEFLHCTFGSAGQHGILLNDGVRDIAIRSCKIAGCNRTNVNAHGIAVLNATHVKIDGCNIGEDTAWGGFAWQPLYGVAVADVVDFISITSNELYGVSTGLDIDYDATVNRIIQNNLPPHLNYTVYADTLMTTNEDQDVFSSKTFVGFSPVNIRGNYLSWSNPDTNVAGWAGGVTGELSGDFVINNQTSSLTALRIKKSNSDVVFIGTVKGADGVDPTDFITKQQLDIAGSLWVDDGSGNISNANTGFVGIKTTNPFAPVEIRGGTNARVGFQASSGSAVINVYDDTGNTQSPVIFKAASFDFQLAPVKGLDATASSHFVTKSQLDNKKAVAQADSTATDVAGLVADYNSLLAKLRAAGLLTT